VLPIGSQLASASRVRQSRLRPTSEFLMAKFLRPFRQNLPRRCSYSGHEGMVLLEREHRPTYSRAVRVRESRQLVTPMSTSESLW
jgi:hypothetical protein